MKTSKPRKSAPFEPEQRLITLIAILLGSKQPLTLDEIRERTDGSYGPLLDPGKQDPQGQKPMNLVDVNSSGTGKIWPKWAFQ